jgi:glucose-6-phosphate dehydrogenase assembly protein OpcA
MLIQVADKVLIDSVEELHPEDSLQSWIGFLSNSGNRLAVGDLAWTHLALWRSLLAQSFQPAEARDHLAGLHAVAIEYSETTEPVHSGMSQALLLAGWLASSLEWTLVHSLREVGEGAREAAFHSEEQDVTVRCVKVSPRGSQAGIESIVCRSSRSGEVAARWSEQERCILIHTSFPGTAACSTALPMHLHTGADLVSRELEVLYRDASYEAAMSGLGMMLSR